MEKKSSSTSAKSSDRFIDKFLLRFKNKHDSRSTPAESRIREYKSPSTSDAQDEESYNEFQYEWQYHKISLEDLRPFCEQLGKFLNYLHSLQDLGYLTYQYPNVLQQQLDKDTNELECLYKEVKSAADNIDRLKKQRRAVHKEKASMKRIWKKIQDEEIREMESTIAMHDKHMFARWESIKNSQKPETLELMLQDIKSKQQALEFLNTLVSRRLGQVQTFPPMISLKESSKERRSSATEDKPTSSSLPKHPPHTAASEFRSTLRRRRRFPQQSQTNDMPLVPFSLNTPLQVLASSVAPAENATSSGNTLMSSNATQISSATTSARNNSDTMGVEFQTEMRSVLQALFGEIRTRGQNRPGNTPASVSINIESLDTENIGETSTTDIELYSLTESPPDSRQN